MTLTTEEMKSLVSDLCSCNPDDFEKKLSDVSSQEYIWILFNLCAQQYKSEENVTHFIANLERLNAFLKSGLLDGSNANADFYYYVGVLNSKIHQYDEIAQYYFDKSIELEKDKSFSVSSANDIQKYTIRFNKRCRKAYCTEYLGKPEQAIIDLIGIDVNTVDYNISVEHKHISKQITKLYSDCQQLTGKRDEFLEKIISFELFKNRLSPDNSLFTYVKLSGIQGHDKSLYLSHIDEIIHILSHCMSEYCKENKGKSNVMLFARLSEILMKALGDNFITCYATLKTENKDFATAYIELSRVKDDIKAKYPNSEYSDEDRKRLAEINFYIWYFATISNYNREDKDICKNEFKDYCVNFGNSNSKVYYALFSLRSALQESFGNMRRDLDFQGKSSENSSLDHIYNKFIKHKPTAYCHNTIIKEWDKLNTIYKIHKCCDLILREEKQTGKVFFELWSVIREYSNSFDIDVTIDENKIKEYNNKFLINLKCGKFIYVGNYDTIKSLLKKMDIQFSIVELPQAYNPTTNANSNMLVLSNANSTNDINELLRKGVNIASQSDKYNIFTNSDIPDINNDITNVYISSDNDSLIVLTVLFTIVEECLSNLQRPFDSFVISPIDDGDTYSYQSGEKINMIEAVSDINIIDIDIPQWKDHFIACYNNLHNTKIERRSLELKNYKGTLPQQVICFKTIKKAEYAYVFNLIESSNTFTFADGIKLYNDFILTEVGNFLNSHKSGSNPKRCHNNICRNILCPSFFMEIDITNETFNELRAYLYSYLNIDIRNKQFFLIKSLNEDVDTKDFVICIFDKKESIKGRIDDEKSLCHSIQKGILTQFEDSYSIENPINKAIRQIETYKCDTTKSYIFISFRSKNSTPNLCQPVFEDFLKLKDKLNLWIDINEATPSFLQDIKSAIENENCIGAFCYISEEYLKWGNDSDYCYEEMKLINEKHSNNNDFIKYPILLNGLNAEKLGQIIKDYSGEANKMIICKSVFEYDIEHNGFGVQLNEYQNNLQHFLTKNNLKNALKKHNILFE
ncbi:hypothetical protein AGMMS49574_05080 [Bacteroidia bacterium]|nr:hypothetical protein AGMMS49574_05080 [Bacteroidia bacterium]